MPRNRATRSRESAVPKRDAFLWESARQKAEAMRDAMAAAHVAWGEYEQLLRSTDSVAKDVTRSAWGKACKARDDAQRDAAFALAYLMLGDDWYAQLRGYTSQDEFTAAILARHQPQPLAAVEGLAP